MTTNPTTRRSKLVVGWIVWLIAFIENSYCLSLAFPFSAATTKSKKPPTTILSAFNPKERDQGSFDPTGLSQRQDFTSNSRGKKFLVDSTKTPTSLQASSKNNDKDKDSSTSSSLSWIFTLILPLWLVYISNQWSRSSIYYLVDFSNDADPMRAMNVDIGFTEAQYGFLASLAFTSLFAVASLAAGAISDRFNRKTLSISAAAVWSLATLGTAMSSSYDQVLSCRIIMGLACAFVTPPAYTLIAERVPEERVSLASSLYGTGVALGGAFASLSILLDNALGWRQSLEVIGIYGFVAAGVAVLILPNDPKESDMENPLNALTKGNSDDDTLNKNNSILSDVQVATSTARIRWLFLASFLRFCSGLCIGVWSASYFRMVFPDSQGDYAVAQALITAVGGSTSGLLGGYIADSVSASAEEQGASDVIGRKLWIPAVGSVLAAPTWYFAVQNIDSFEVAMAWLAASYLVAECWFGPTISVLQKTVGPKVGGTSQGLFTLTGALANVAPSLLGFLYGQQQQNAGSQETSSELAGLLVTGVCFCYLSCAFAFSMAAISEPPRKDAKEAQL